MIRADGCDLRNDHTQLVPAERFNRGLAKLHDRIDRGDVLDAGAPRDGGEIGDAGCGVRIESAGREEAAVVEDEVDEVPWSIPRQRRKRAEIHEYGTIAVEHDDRFAR